MNQASPTRSPWLARGALFAAFATLLATAPLAAQANPRHHGERAQVCRRLKKNQRNPRARWKKFSMDEVIKQRVAVES